MIYMKVVVLDVLRLSHDTVFACSGYIISHRLTSYKMHDFLVFSKRKFATKWYITSITYIIILQLVSLL